MGNQIVWQDRFNIGVDSIDREHRKLFGIINKLFALSDQEEKSQWVCQEGIKYFKDHAMKHFTDEEAYMASISYGGFEAHRRAHDNFRKNTLPALERELEQTRYAKDAVSHFIGVCAGWLIGHTLTEDHAITGKAMSKWVNLRPEEEQIAMRQAILQLLNDMFQLEARVISERYRGERFGKGIYYRLIYSTEKGEEWETILVFEEKLLLETMGKIMGGESDALNVMMMNATRYTAKQFVEGIRQHIPSTELYELKAENLLSYEQFNRVFERQRPQYSLLFDTGAGYFAYCVIAPHLVGSKTGTFIKAENAMVEVRKYLDDAEEENKAECHKRKILVVDDSEMMRQTMKKLLSPDYHVSLAQSGLSAIRCMTLERPDLVLLDYEMPVCDGAQVLEMIRAEEDFGDIPVVFLTSRADKEGISKLMPLKPEGYLLKSLKPLDIKKNIDDFFNSRKK